MRRFVTTLLAGAIVVTGVPVVHADTTTTGGSNPGTATIDAGVHHYFGRWSGRHSNCSWDLFSGDTALDHAQGSAPVKKVVGGIEYRLFLKDCAGQADAIVWVGPPNGRRLVGDARDDLVARLPKPRLVSAPPADRIYVTVQTWIWTTTHWDEVSITAWVPTEGNGTVWATTTATPRVLRLDPGDGSDPVECEGPGEEWAAEMAADVESSCGHVFRHSSVTAPDGRTFRGSLAIDWDVEWTSSTGEGGALAAMTTTTPVGFTVGEIQAVVTSRGASLMPLSGPLRP